MKGRIVQGCPKVIHARFKSGLETDSPSMAYLVGRFLFSGGPACSLAFLFAILIYAALIQPGPVMPSLVAFLSAFMIWGAAEWAFHRYIMHAEPLPLLSGLRITGPVHDLHMKHHRDPGCSDGLLFSFGSVLCVLTCIFLVSVASTLSLYIALSISAAAATRLFFYDFVHFLSHTGYCPGSGRLALMVRKHRMHHHQSSAAFFGVSSLYPDRIFGTDQGRVTGGSIVEDRSD